MADADKSEGQSTARRDYLAKIEVDIQKSWKKRNESTARVDADGNRTQEKFMATFPYPYMNGTLHLGHGFTLAKPDFACRYQKLLGKNVMYPFAFHCTGQPIEGAAMKIRREMTDFGNPPQFPPQEGGEDVKVEVSAEAKLGSVGKSKKTKATAKKGGKFQFEIMKESGVTDDDIPKFKDPNHWLKHFPPLTMKHLKRFGVCVDWRRSFITTDVNPYYDAFVRWQFRTLKAKDKLFWGKRLCVYSPYDEQPCADHDRTVGEGVGLSEYALIKLELLKPYPAVLQSLLEKEFKGRVILPAATLRPETMYGQTNCYLLPEGDYGVYEVNDGDVFVCSERSAANMSYQHLTPVWAKPKQLGSVKGEALLGSAVIAPLSTYPKVYVLPLLTIKMDKGTGVVTSVPSDSPDDYAALMDLKNKKPLREKYGLKDEMVLPFEVVPVLETPGLGTTPARDLCIEMKVSGQNDAKKIEIIKEKCYTEGFHKGVMIVGDYKGETVSVARGKIKADLIKAGLALAYGEPESQVISRSGCECVAAWTDQWYLKYGEAKWKQQIVNHVDGTLKTYNPAAHKAFHEKIDWIHEWPCSRSSGLGTNVPWDEQFVIESLSDSTIYMAYYTVAHILQGPDNLEGSKVGPGGIRADQLTDAVWNYIFLKVDHPDYPKDCGIPQAVLDECRREFEYWYPMDLRVSGKDLIGNHLTFSLYTHAAIWDKQPELWPRGYFTNGHLCIDAKKMSKSLGNFITLSEAIDLYGADVTRLALADAGDKMEDANFDKLLANALISTLTKEGDWIKEQFSPDAKLRTGAYNFLDEVFANDMNTIIDDAKKAYDNLQFHEVVASGFRRLLAVRDSYRTDESDLHRTLVHRWCEALLVMLWPICPHWTQATWRDIKNMGKKQDEEEEEEKESVTRWVEDAGWPTTEPEVPEISRKSKFLREIRGEMGTSYRKKLELALKRNPTLDSKAAITALNIYFAQNAPVWMNTTLEALEGVFKENGALPDTRALSGILRALPMFEKDKKALALAMTYASKLAEDSKTQGADAFRIGLGFDEAKFIKENTALVLRGIPVEHINLVMVNPDSPPAGAAAGEGEPQVPTKIDVLPGQPQLFFYRKL